MKTILKLFLILLTSAVFAQDGWYYQTPHGMRDVQFVTPNKIVAVGRGIWVSTDIQNNWEGVYPGYDQTIDTWGYSKWLTAVDFPTSSNGYAVGVGPNTVIVKTTNGGYDWKTLNTNFSWANSELHDVKFINSETGFAVGYAYLSGWKGIIIRTTDGGKTWTLVLESSILFRAIEITPNNTIWAAGGTHQIAKSTDLGTTWNEINVAPGSETYSITYDIKFIDDEKGLLHLATADKLFRTTDGGGTWDLIETGLVGTSWQFQYFGDGTVYTSLQDDDGGSAFYKSTNHGQDWSLVNYSEDSDISGSFTFLTKELGIFDGSTYGSTHSTFYLTTDGGATLEGFNTHINRLYFIPNTTKGWAISYNHIFKTTNGKTWTFDKMVNSSGYDITQLVSLQFVDETKGFSIGWLKTAPLTTSRKFMNTTDGGMTWNDYDFEYGPNGFHFINETFGWVVGYGGMIYKTLDGGATWGPQESGTSASLLNVFFYNEELGWIVGEENTLLKTTNGGLLWEKVDLSTFPNYSLNSIASYGGEICYLEGSDYLLKSPDAGDTWFEISKPAEFSSSYYDYQKIIPVSDTELYLFFGNGYYHSNDGGGTWNLIKENAKTIYPQTWQNIWVASDGILYTQNAGIVGVGDRKREEALVNDFKLSQNYPNPFNPSTKIIYSIPKASNVKLVVFDALGRELKILVNQAQNAGSYSIDFNAEDLASGVYFYRISAGNFAQTNKMILIK